MQYEQPQSQAEVLLVETELRRMDDRLRIRWNPKAIITKPGRINAVGHSERPEYAGRWQVERIGGEGDLIPSIIYVVREDRTEAYKPVGEWLVAFFRKWDSAQSHFLEQMRKEWQEHDELMEHQFDISDEQEATDFLEEQYMKLGGGKHFIGRGF